MKITVHTDGGSRGNPGEGAIGVVISSGDRVITEFGKKIGVVTNNEAEYRAVIEALTAIKNEDIHASTIECFLDSKLVCEQVQGNWKIKKSHLRTLCDQARSLISQLGVPVTFTHVLRDKNKRADELLNEALDSA